VWLVIGILIAGLITYAVPDSFFRDTIGHGIGAMLLMMVVGIPLYVCATASIPIVAALMLKGLSPGAALVFLMTGPATNSATVTLIWRKLGSRVTVAYLASIGAGALAFGALLDLAYNALAIEPTASVGAHALVPAWLRTSGAMGLGLLLVASLIRKGWALIGGRRTSCEHEGTDSAAFVLSVEGMTCAHCVETVETALSSLPGVECVEVDLPAGRAVVRGAVGHDEAVAAVQEAGYVAVPVSERESNE
jgi:copper chaperone CopZ